MERLGKTPKGHESKSFQSVQRLVQCRRTNSLPTCGQNDVGGNTFIDDSSVDGLLIDDYMNKKGNLMRELWNMVL